MSATVVEVVAQSRAEHTVTWGMHFDVYLEQGFNEVGAVRLHEREVPQYTTDSRPTQTEMQRYHVFKSWQNSLESLGISHKFFTTLYEPDIA